AGADADRATVVAEFRPAHDLADRQALVPGVGRLGVHRRGAGDAGVDRLYWPTIWSISFASARSFCVIPPSECVDNTKVTVRQRISMSGWWSAASARSAMRRTASIPS